MRNPTTNPYTYGCGCNQCGAFVCIISKPGRLTTWICRCGAEQWVQLGPLTWVEMMCTRPEPVDGRCMSCGRVVVARVALGRTTMFHCLCGRLLTFSFRTYLRSPVSRS